MKKTKQSSKKVKGDKLSFRVNPVEDRKIIEYMEKATNGSAFVKDAVKFYIHNIEANRIRCYWIQSEEERFNDIINNMNAIEEPSFHINEIDYGNEQIQNNNNRIELTLDDNDDYIFDDLEDYKSANN